MSELMNQLGKTQEEVRRLSARVDRADAMLAKAGDTEHALKEEVQALMVERDQLLEERDDLYEARKELQADVEFLTKERDEALERLKQKDAKPVVPVQEAFLRLSKAAFDASNAQHMKDRETALKALDDHFGDWMAVTIAKIVD